MKAHVEGVRALIVKGAMHLDRAAALAGKDDAEALYHQGQVELLTPMIKAYSSDIAFRVAETAIQVMGGVGYTADYPVEQHCRDAKIFSIYEGTNGIQALDLVARKLGQNGGMNTQRFLGDIAAFAERNREHPVLGPAVANLSLAQEAVAGSVMQLLVWFQGGEVERVPLVANRFLTMMSELTVGWLLLDAASSRSQKQAKLPAYGRRTAPSTKARSTRRSSSRSKCFPGIVGSAKMLAAGDTSVLDIPDAAFATI